MSILKKLNFLFKKEKVETLEETIPVTKEESPKNPVLPEQVLYIYSHGFTNGVYKVEPDKDHFEDFLLANAESEKVSEQRRQNERRLTDSNVHLNSRMTAYEQVQETLIDSNKKAEHLKIKIDEIDQLKSIELEKEKLLIEQRKNTHAEYAWIPAILYLAAGIVFIVGDVSITHQITSWGFDMKGIEGWIFAIGLAFTAFLIKPVLDRLLEKPFQKSGLQMHRVYKTVLMMITVLGITMLFLLGKFRSESQVAATKLGDINYQMQSLSDPNSVQYIRLADQRKQINEDLTSNPVGEWGIILSGIIFAIGGALCLSISFPSLTQLMNRYWILPARIRKTNRNINRLTDERHKIKTEIRIIAGDILKAEHKLQGFDFTKIHEEIKQLEEEQKRLLVEYYEIQFRKEKNLYQDGRNRGEKYSIDGDLLYNAVDNDPTELFQKNGKNATEDGKPPRRPFVKIRKMIADNYNKNLNKNSPDGTEFEILS